MAEKQRDPKILEHPDAVREIVEDLIRRAWETARSPREAARRFRDLVEAGEVIDGGLSAQNLDGPKAAGYPSDVAAEARAFLRDELLAEKHFTLEERLKEVYIDALVFGGERDSGLYPECVSIYRRHEYHRWFDRSAVVLSPRLVLTARHKLGGKDLDYQVRLGVEGEGSLHPVRRIHRPIDDVDLALLELESDRPIEGVRPATIGSVVQGPGTIVGHGGVGWCQTSVRPGVRRVAGNLSFETFPRRLLFSSPHVYVAKGDSGGGCFLENPVEPNPRTRLLIGIASQCPTTTDNVQSEYTRVDVPDTQKWIDEVLEGLPA